MRQLITSDEEDEADGQHTTPCSDCPWARHALRRWLGHLSVEKWLELAHGEATIDCHALRGAQCAGAAIYRANTCKLPRDPDNLRLSANRESCFATPDQFRKHHS